MIIAHTEKYKMMLEGLFFKVIRKLFSTFYHAFKLRPGSPPYITGDSFRSLADHIYDETSSFDPLAVQQGDIVFVGMSRILEFLTDLHPHIQNQYILIEHNGDGAIDQKIAKLLDDKIIRFYAQCVTVADKKIVPIPIGIENKHHGIEGFSWFMPQAIPPSKKRTPRIFFHFSPQTNPNERIPAMKYFKTHDSMDTINTFIPYRSYKKLLGSYCFTASPAGNTLGSHRTWEALYLRTIPIVKRTADAEACASRGLPLWILDEWNELEEYNEEKLAKKYTSMLNGADFSSLYMDYWIKCIKADQQALRSQV